MLADLIRWADVYGESFSPGVVDRMGFGYAAARALNPDIIMVSSSLLGQSGPWRDYAGFGNLAAAVCGFYQLAGAADAPPAGCFGPYTDFMGVRYNAIAMLAALAHRDRTGEGQFIDMAQAEAALHFLAPAAFGISRNENRRRDRVVIATPRWRRTACIRRGASIVGLRSRCARTTSGSGCAGTRSGMTLRTIRRLRHSMGANVPRIESMPPCRVGHAIAMRCEIEHELQALGIAAHALLDTHELLRNERNCSFAATYSASRIRSSA